MLKSTNLCYPLLLIMSTGKRSFTALGQIINKSGDTIRRMLNPTRVIFQLLDKIAIRLFRNKKYLFLSIDETLIKKMFSRFIEGTDDFFDTKTNTLVMSYKLLVVAITDGKYTIPLRCTFVPSNRAMQNAAVFKEEYVKQLIVEIRALFPDKIVIVTADGAFATKRLLTWAIDSNISVEMRMHSNRVILYKGKKIKIRDIKDLIPKGRHMARTIQATWHDIPLEITADRRIDKYGEESIVYQVATYTTSPSQHVAAYKNRWPIEKINRTTKQYIGLQECFSTKIDTQLQHVASVLLAYAFAQIEMKKQHFTNPEKAIRYFRRKDFNFLKQRFDALDQNFFDAHA